MKTKMLGRSPLSIAPLMFGGNVFGWTVDQKTCNALLDAFVDAGFNAIDTADSYSGWVEGNVGGESETMIGNWFKASGKRAKIMLATKVASPMGPGKQGLSKKYVLQACEDSLRRLQTDCIDLYQSHRDDLTIPFQETLEAYDALIKAGKVRVLGTSNQKAGRLQEALKTSRDHNLPRYETVQPRYNLLDRFEYEGELEALCRQEGLGVIPHSTLASGFLTGKYRSEADFDKSKRGTRALRSFSPRSLKIVKALDEVASQCGAKPSQVAIAWVLANDSVTAPIASATNLDQLAELIGAVTLTLKPDALALLNEVSREKEPQASA
jgi:aryl-alcohol dehydrogenase-like predicted oxidoreductase